MVLEHVAGHDDELGLSLLGDGSDAANGGNPLVADDGARISGNEVYPKTDLPIRGVEKANGRAHGKLRVSY